MSRSLIVAPQWIGDAVMSEPCCGASQRAVSTAVAALPWVAPVYRAMPQVSDVIELPFAHGRLDWAERRRVAAGLRGRFDAAYVLPNSLKSALIPWLARIPARIGYAGESRFILLNRRLPNPAGRPPMVAFYSALADQPVPDGETPGHELRAGGDRRGHEWRRRRAGGLLGLRARRRVRPGQVLAGRALCRTRALAVRRARPAGAAAGLGQGGCAVRDHRRRGARGLPCAGRQDLAAGAMALIAAARGVVSNDSGLMHVAAAFGVPQAAVFGSTSPEHTPPLNPRARVIWLKEELQLDCMPCFDRVCRFGHTRCLTEVSAARVDTH